MTTPGRPSALFDTNVLVYASDATAPQHAAAKALRDRVEAGEMIACVALQNLLEYVSLITTKRVTSPRTVAEAWAEVAALSSVFQVLLPPDDVLERLQNLVPSVKPHGPDVFDMVIAATALAHGVKVIYTFDRNVFARVSEIEVREP